uniref:Uncharacterized protein n=1 Tax=Aegilops tauschii subsp. strangulata TaxID=200361 RepID=A0A453HV36_AEGTS
LIAGILATSPFFLCHLPSNHGSHTTAHCKVPSAFPLTLTGTLTGSTQAFPDSAMAPLCSDYCMIFEVSNPTFMEHQVAGLRREVICWTYKAQKSSWQQNYLYLRMQ